MKKIIYFLIVLSIILILNGIDGQNINISQEEGVINLTILAICQNGFCTTGENCSTCPQDCGVCPVPVPPPAGGVGGRPAIQPDFEFDINLIKVLVRQGETFKTSFKIKNIEDFSQDFEISLSSSLKGLVFLSENSFSINGGEEKEIFVTISSTLDTLPGGYTGKLEISTFHRTKEISVIIEVETVKVIFDVSLEIPPEYRSLFAGEPVLLDVTIFNLGTEEEVIVFVKYLIKDFEGNVIVEEEDFKSVERQISYSRLIDLPIMPIGDYVAIVEVVYKDSVGTSSEIFRVVEPVPPVPLVPLFYFLWALLLILLILFLWWLYKKYKEWRESRVDRKYALKKAVGGISAELKKLQLERNTLKKQISDIDSSRKGARRLEERLKNKISKLHSQEGKLAQKKRNTQRKMQEIRDLKKRIGKL